MSETQSKNAEVASTQQTSDFYVEPPAPTRSSVSTLMESISSSTTYTHFAASLTGLNEAYSELSSEDIELLSLTWLRKLAEQDTISNRSKYSLLIKLSEIFNDKRLWQAVVLVSIEQQDWQAVLAAQIKRTGFESDPIEIEQSMQDLLRTSLVLKAELEKAGDTLSVVSMFQNLYNLFPAYPRFQLELANSQMEAGQFVQASAHLSVLSNDPQYGSIAQTMLLKASQQLQTIESDLNTENTSSKTQIVVPLQRLGTSYLLNTEIQNRPVRLLLDTGASITTLSAERVAQLALEPLNQRIRVQTANGETIAPLYKAKGLRLGRLQIQEIQVAALPLGSGVSFDGLLGTDVLNILQQDYSYLIDGQQSALIFQAN